MIWSPTQWIESRGMHVEWAAIRWWELRRIPYNLLLFVTGIFSIALVFWMENVTFRPGEDDAPPLLMLFALLFYAFAANFFYTLGWITEAVGGPRDEGGRKRLYKAGLYFSIALTALPGFLAVFILIIYKMTHR